MDREFIYFIIGCIVIAPALFVIIRHNHRRKHDDNYVPPKNDLNDPTSLSNFHRRNPPPG